MPTYLAKLLLLFLAGAFIWWHVRTVRAAARRSPEDADIQQAVLIPAVVMTLALACNALAFMGMCRWPGRSGSPRIPGEGPLT